jgi:hypothetical protein
MSQPVRIERKIEAVETAEGSGATVQRVFPTDRLWHLDPFVLLDEFTVTPPAAFPEHPHGGFEAITYMLDGAFRHRDNLGNDQIVSAGGVQRFTAGERIVHAELPGSEETSHGLQLWVNLPQALKETEPAYQPIPASEIPDTEEGDVRIRTVVGPCSPVELHTAVRYLDVRLPSGGRFEDQVPEAWSGLIYVLEGELSIGGSALGPREAVTFERGGHVEVMAEGKARFALIAGEPHDEPIRLRGSFVA